MANFNISLVDPGTMGIDIVDDGILMTITDHSNYDDVSPEAGHAQADFDLYRKITIDNPDYTQYVFSGLGDGDAALEVPADALAFPMETEYTHKGDGIYRVTIEAVPTWNNAAAYLSSTNPVVYWQSKLWQALVDSTGENPATSTGFWAEIPEPTAKYKTSVRFVVTTAMQKNFARKTYQAICVNNKVGCRWEDLFRDPDFIAAVRLSLSITALPILIEYQNWQEVEKTINFTKAVVE